MSTPLVGEYWPPDFPTDEELEAISPPKELEEEDGTNLETSWHRDEINLLIDSVEWRFQGRKNFYVGGNMFIYFEMQQVRKERYFRGPDFFFVDDVDHDPPRKYWAVWEERCRLPDVIIELGSKSTLKEDRTEKKEVYEQTFKTPEYFCYDPAEEQLDGWRLGTRNYETIMSEVNGRLESKELGLWLGLWKGVYLGHERVWLRFFDAAGNLVLTRAEAAEQQAAAESQRAETERQRAEAAEAELNRLRAFVAAQGLTPPTNGPAS